MEKHKETISIHQREDGAWVARLHGRKIYLYGDTAFGCLASAGQIIDIGVKDLEESNRS